MASPVFPQDIFLLIIDELGLNWWGVRTLKSCALACKNFVDPARRYLFREVKLSNETRCIGFAEIIKLSPDIARHIHRLLLFTHSYKNDQVPATALSNVIALLNNVEYLSVEGDYTDHDLPTLLQAPLFELLSSLKLETLRFKNIRNLPMSITECFSHIPNVTLIGVYWNESDLSGNDSQLYSRPSLKPEAQARTLQNLSLKLKGISGFLELPLVDMFSPPKCYLESLRLSSEGDFNVGFKIANSNSKTLTSFGIIGVSHPSLSIQVRHLEAFPRLKNLSCSTRAIYAQRKSSEAFNFIRLLFPAVVGTNNVLEEIRIFISINYDEGYPFNFHEPDFDELDNFLDSDPRFRNVERIVLVGQGHVIEPPSARWVKRKGGKYSYENCNPYGTLW